MLGEWKRVEDAKEPTRGERAGAAAVILSIVVSWGLPVLLVAVVGWGLFWLFVASV